MKEIKSAYSKKLRVKTKNTLPTKTKQALVEQADINHLIKRHGINHVVTQMHDLEAVYGDITSQDLQEAMQLQIDAESAFMEVPSHIRKQFGNDPGAFIDFATDPNNQKQLLEWGLMTPPPPPETPIPVEVINQGAEPEPSPAT